MTEDYQKYKVCMVRITIKTHEGNLSNGAGFHIGGGYIVTARHVVERHEIEEVVGGFGNQNVNIKNIFYPSDSRIDLAVMETDFSLDYYMNKGVIIVGKRIREKVECILLGGHLDDWLDDELVLSKVMVFGYPIIPFVGAQLVAVEGEVNAIIDKYNVPHPHFIISTIPRGGFSGGPVISEYGFLLGVLTESLVENNKDAETGFASAISIEPLLNLLYENRIMPREIAEVFKSLEYAYDIDCE
ncbi:S1 family peptidase [Candidatus Aquicultor sp.]